MNKLKQTTKIILFDTLGVLCMIASILLGWLPGPGGIPLFLVGLGLIAVHHEWAERYIDLIKKYADRIGDLIFVENRAVKLLYDVVSVLLASVGIWLITTRPSTILLAAGVSLSFIALLIFLRNRHRLRKIKHKISNS